VQPEVVCRVRANQRDELGFFHKCMLHIFPVCTYHQRNHYHIV